MVVELENVVVRFGDIQAVAGASLQADESEVYGLLGPNGAGKTTSLRVLTTLLRPDEGSARVAGFDVLTQGLEVRASIGYVPQAISVDGALTASENLDFYARVTGVSRRERRERIDEVIDTMDLQAMLDRLARDLSGGMLRRLEIATALLNRPRVLFLDEPTVGLDPTARRMVWDRLHALRAEAGTTIVVTTHQMEEAERHCDRLSIMDHGEIVAQGAPAALIEENGCEDLEEVFTVVTGHGIEEEGGRLRDVRAQRRVAQRLG
jgi:ABC-2 type transport system ATP-binding protein